MGGQGRRGREGSGGEEGREGRGREKRGDLFSIVKIKSSTISDLPI